ncbi:MAG TPA: hydrogen peroxide-dependent heme synthase [Verrucomicrobiae bacterium]|jgi:chlorite dismutase
MTTPAIKLNQGIHVMHLFYRLNRQRWAQLPSGESLRILQSLTQLCGQYANPSHPRLCTYANVCGKADLVFMLYAAELQLLAQMHRDLENLFPPGCLETVYSYLSVTELSEYMPTEEDNKNILAAEKLEPGSEAWSKRAAELAARMKEYEHYRLYPELPDWEIMAFYAMNKRRQGGDNWYSLDFATRKKMMGGHARVGRKYSGRITQLITGSTGLDDWEWGVTLVAHQVDAIKEIVYEMRFDEVTARFGEFGPFYINMRLQPGEVWRHLHL